MMKLLFADPSSVLGTDGRLQCEVLKLFLKKEVQDMCNFC
jgi:hypothetical protein